MKTVKMPVLDRNAKTITATREFLIRAGQFGSTEFNILLDIQKSNPGYTVKEHKIKRNPNKNAHEALNYEEMIDFIKGNHTSEEERKEALTEFFIIQKASKTTPAAYAYVKKWFFGKYKAEFEAYEQAKKDKKEADANKELEEFLAAAI